MNPFLIATKGKGIRGTLKRANAIRGRYGVTSSRMDQQFARLVSILRRFDCGATFPIVAAALMRAKGFGNKYQDRTIEFAIHGYFHVDHTQLSLEQQTTTLQKAREMIQAQELNCSGFRCPYLRWNNDTLTAIRQAGFLYDTSQGLAWDVVDQVNTPAYERVLDFYGALPASDYPALPHLEGELIRIPYCLPDDEALVERFHLSTAADMFPLWEAILMESYRLGELFTLGLHPERITYCETLLVKILQQARELSPGIWFARLDEIARWWKARSESSVTIEQVNDQEYEICVYGPEGVTVLARNVELLTPSSSWDSMIQRSLGTVVRFRADRRPFIGLSSSSPPALASFLCQQGYIVEPAMDDHKHTYYLNRRDFNQQDQRPILKEVEQADFPLVRLGRWPNGARSALNVTGDIDALTLWDYGLRFVGR